MAINSIICDELDFQIVYDGNSNLSSIINAGINIGIGIADCTDRTSTNQLASMDSPITNDLWTPDSESTMTNNSIRSNTITSNYGNTPKSTRTSTNGGGISGLHKLIQQG